MSKFEMIEEFLSSPEGKKWANERVALFINNEEGRLTLEVMLGQTMTLILDAVDGVKFGLMTEFIGQGEDYLIGLVDALDSFRNEIVGDNSELFPEQVGQ